MSDWSIIVTVSIICITIMLCVSMVTTAWKEKR